MPFTEATARTQLSAGISLDLLGEETNQYKRGEELSCEIGHLDKQVHLRFSPEKKYFPFESFAKV